MSDFDYKKYLKVNPLLEKMTDKEREDKLQQAIRGGGEEEPLRKLAAIGKKSDFGPEHGAVEDEYGDDAAMDDEYEKTIDPDYDKADEDEEAYEKRLKLNEYKGNNPDLEKKIVSLVSRCAKEYDISVWEAFQAIESKMSEMKDYFKGDKEDIKEETRDPRKK